MLFDLLKFFEPLADRTFIWTGLSTGQDSLLTVKIPIDTRGRSYKVSISTYLSRFRSKAVETGRWLLVRSVPITAGYQMRTLKNFSKTTFLYPFIPFWSLTGIFKREFWVQWVSSFIVFYHHSARMKFVDSACICLLRIAVSQITFNIGRKKFFYYRAFINECIFAR
jgi:hypothetical protein